MDDIHVDDGADGDNYGKISKMTMSIPNCITLSRIAGALCLLTLEVTAKIASPFWLVYIFSGMTDMADGYVARKLKTATKVGALLDSIADIVFVICCSCKLIPILTFPLWLWYLVAIIAGIKVVNQISAWIVHKRLLFPHTFVNKLTGLLLFLSLPLYVGFEMIAPLVLTYALAMYAAIQEGHYIRTR